MSYKILLQFFVQRLLCVEVTWMDGGIPFVTVLLEINNLLEIITSIR